MNRYLTSMLAALGSKRMQPATRTSDPHVASLPNRRIGLRVLAFAVLAALFGLSPAAQAQDRGERGDERGKDRGCERGDERGKDRGCKDKREGERPQPPAGAKGSDVDQNPPQ